MIKKRSLKRRNDYAEYYCDSFSSEVLTSDDTIHDRIIGSLDPELDRYKATINRFDAATSSVDSRTV